MSQSSGLQRAIGVVSAAAVCAVALAVPAAQQTPIKKSYPLVRDQRGVIPPGPKVPPYNSPPLGDGPWQFDTYEQRNIRVSVVAKGLSHPWSVAFLPGGDMLITERIGRLRVVRNGVLDAAPVPGIPAVTSIATMAGLMDIALHPRYAENQWVYISYHKPRGTAPDVTGKDYPVASNAIMRGRWTGKALADLTDIYVSDDVDMEMSRIAFGRDGMLYMTIGGPGTGPAASLDRPQHGNDDAGKILRMTDEGKVPPDNPFVGKAGFKPYIYTMGHRTQLALALNPFTGEMWSGEQGPNGGDEVNILKPGRNYGWPFVTDGRDYRGHYLTPVPYRDGMERPHILWVPSIAVSGMAFYTGDRFPHWKGNLFVGALRDQMLVRLQLDGASVVKEERLLKNALGRIRDVRMGPDGLIYLLTDESNGVLARLEPQ